jgi:hypothetical protein
MDLRINRYVRSFFAQHASCRLRSSSRLTQAVFHAVALLLAVLSSNASAATHQYEVLIDTDANAATGCSVSTSAGAAIGVERIVRATVLSSTATATVTANSQLNCLSDSTFSAPTALPGAPYALQLAQGGNGNTAIEMALALTDIPSNPDATQPTVVRLGALSLAGDQSADALLPLAAFQVRAGVPLADAPLVAIPTINQRALVVLALLLAAVAVWLIRRYGADAFRGKFSRWLAASDAGFSAAQACWTRSKVVVD